MADTSTRLLLDRSTILVDGLPFFAFGVRLFLTPKSQIPTAVREIADAGFNVIGTPPASPGNLSTLHTIFDEAERNGLLVIIYTEPRFPTPGEFLAAHFKHRESLHSYCIMTTGDRKADLDWFRRERDKLRIHDLFHPIWTPLKPGYPLELWAESSELHSAAQGNCGPYPVTDEDDGAGMLGHVLQTCITNKFTGRPFFCHSLQVNTPDRARENGVFSFDPLVNRVPPRVDDWYPYLANLGTMKRHDLLGPDPNLIRLRAFEMLGMRVRGVVASYYEFLQGAPPTTGRDRFFELSTLAHETAVISEFISQGQLVAAQVETGHPRVRAGLLSHDGDILMLLWRHAEGDEFWLDPTQIRRIEISLQVDSPEGISAWRLDFPLIDTLQVGDDGRGGIRIALDSINLTAMVLITRTTDRPRALAERIETRLPKAALSRMRSLEHRLEKIKYVESELASLKVGRRQEKELKLASEKIANARDLLDHEVYSQSWSICEEADQLFREIINRQMVSALSETDVRTDSLLHPLRQSYYTLPPFYRELTSRASAVIADYT